MSTMAEMDQTIKELRDAAAINSAADWLHQQFSSTDVEPDPQPEETQAEPESKKELKLEDVRKVLAERSEAHRRTAGLHRKSAIRKHRIRRKLRPKADPADHRLRPLHRPVQIRAKHVIKALG